MASNRVCPYAFSSVANAGMELYFALLHPLNIGPSAVDGTRGLFRPRTPVSRCSPILPAARVRVAPEVFARRSVPELSAFWTGHGGTRISPWLRFLLPRLVEHLQDGCRRHSRAIDYLR